LVANLEHAERCDQRWPTEINAQLKRIVTEEGATYVDLRPLFCAANRCPAITEDTLIYADGNHLTIAFSSARASWLVDTLRPLLTAR
jgi:lysophospholipase L1-like esterase